MSKGKVVNIHKCKDKDVIYIGRPRKASSAYQWGTHWGNPFSHLRPSPIDCVQVETREEAVESYRLWLNEQAYLDVEPYRRNWINDHVHELRGKTLGCYCAPDSCHGDVLLEFANRKERS